MLYSAGRVAYSADCIFCCVWDWHLLYSRRSVPRQRLAYNDPQIVCHSEAGHNQSRQPEFREETRMPSFSPKRRVALILFYFASLVLLKGNHRTCTLLVEAKCISHRISLGEELR
jgi:hypothetical protein